MKTILSIILLALCLSSTAYTQRNGRHNKLSAITDSVLTEKPTSQVADRHIGHYNYTYLRLATFFPSPGFGNPITSGFNGSTTFSMGEDVPNNFRLGYESGKVRHFMKLNLGTPMLKLAINSGIALQAFGEGKKEQQGSKASTGGLYLMKLALGPQVTFKPIEELRVAVYYRAGIALLYSRYDNEERTVIAPDRVRIDKANTYFINYAYHGDFGIDVSYRALCIGVSMQMLKLKPSKGALFSRSGTTDEYNALTTLIEQNGIQDGDKVITPLDPIVNFNRLCVSIGCAL